MAVKTDLPVNVLSNVIDLRNKNEKLGIII